VSIRLWRLTQRRLRNPSAAKKLQSIRTSDETLSISGKDEDVDNILNFENDDDRPVYLQPRDCLDLDDEGDDEDLLDVQYESEWKDLFTDPSVVGSPVDDDMLDRLYGEVHHDDDENMFSCDLEDGISSVLEEMLEL
jgi:hypothetical protein